MASDQEPQITRIGQPPPTVHGRGGTWRPVAALFDRHQINGAHDELRQCDVKAITQLREAMSTFKVVGPKKTR